MVKTFIDWVQGKSEVVLIIEGEFSKLTIDPTCTGFHESIITGKLIEDKILKQWFYTQL